MRRPKLRSALLVGTAMSFAVIVSPAQAFDTINWNWDLDVQTNVTQTVDITANITADSIAIVENEQTFEGAATAISTVTAPINTPPIDPLDPTAPIAIENLPKVESTAVAVANNATIESDVMTDVSSSQTAGTLSVDDPLLGLIPGIPVLLTATSDVSGSVDVQVESTAQAIANNLSITLDGPDPADRVLKANNVQIANATIAATSTVANPAVTNYEGLGTLETAWVSSTAMAVGNNLNIDISAPSP